jgi:serine/threonine protein phosphatase 1
MNREYTPLKVENTKNGRRFAIGDIHGCYFVFKKLIDNQLNITKNDQIFILGDLIDKGHNSALVLDLILELKKNGFQMYPIKGNHEEKLMLSYNCGFDFFESYLTEYNSLDLLDGDLEIYLEFISNFDYCIELDNCILSHCGINEKRINPFTDLRGMFPNINFKFNEEEYLSKTQIHGHMVKTIQEIQNNVKNKEIRFSIDSGCYLQGNDFGYLTALDLDTMELFHQKAG